MPSKLSRRRLLQIAGATGAAVTALGYVIGESLTSHHPLALQRHLPVVGVITSDILSPVARENRLPGTTNWEITAGADTSFIQGYASQVSATPGETVTLYISTKVPSFYNIDVYRIGWYGGAGGRLHFSHHHLKSIAQGIWTYTKGLMNNPTALIDLQTHLVDANWHPSFELPIGADWTSGVYLIKLTATPLAGLITAQSYIPLVVRDPQDRAAVLFSIPINTYQAYNKWGGSSLYGLEGAWPTGEGDTGTKATKVSFNRPYDRSAGAGDFLAWDIHTLQWVEREDYDVSYTTNIDTAVNPGALLRHRVILSGGHDEYWTKSMRDGMEAARDHGVNLAFFGANAAYWQARLEPDQAGTANRTLTCFKVSSKAKTPQTGLLSNDPLFREQPEVVTAQWRDRSINRPENALLGLMYSSYINFIQRHSYYLPDWVVAPGKLDNFMVGTGFTPGKHVKGGLLGYEYDRIWDNGHTPSSLVVLAQSPIIDVYGTHQLAGTAYYRAESGALVFDAGTMWWGWGLSEISPRGAYQANLLKGNESIKALTRNILDAMLSVAPAAPAIIPTPTP